VKIEKTATKTPDYFGIPPVPVAAWFKA